MGFPLECKQCGSTRRISRSDRPGKTRCADCAYAAKKKWRKVHPDRAKAERDASSEYMKAYNKEWYKDNRVKRLEQCKEYRQNNRGQYNQYSAKRRANKKKATPKWADFTKISAYYKKASDLKLEVDHIAPLQGKNVCGLHCEDNLQLLSMIANRQKGNSHVST